MSDEDFFNSGDDVCSIKVLHEEPIKRAKEKLLKDDIYMELSETFRLFGNPTRLKIMTVLSEEDLCVCDICEILDMSQSAVSHQLRTLREKNLVKYTKEGKQARYSLADKHVLELLNIGIEHVTE